MGELYEAAYPVQALLIHCSLSIGSMSMLDKVKAEGHSIHFLNQISLYNSYNRLCEDHKLRGG